MRDVVTVHYLMEDADGPMGSGPEGISDPDNMLAHVGVPAIERKRLRFACDASKKAVMSHHHRGTNAVHKGAGDRYLVSCEKCLASADFQAAAKEAAELNGPAVMFDREGKRCC